MGRFLKTNKTKTIDREKCLETISNNLSDKELELLSKAVKNSVIKKQAINALNKYSSIL